MISVLYRSIQWDTVQVSVLIWRNGAHFTNLHSGHIVITMAIFSTIKYIERNEKNHLFKKIVFRKYFLLIWFCYLLHPGSECACFVYMRCWDGGSFWIWKIEAGRCRNIVCFSDERRHEGILELFLKYLPFIGKVVPHIFTKFILQTNCVRNLDSN